jgi:hypothetical protein
MTLPAFLTAESLLLAALVILWWVKPWGRR